jgi:transglutaminase-like putative cysteine protease
MRLGRALLVIGLLAALGIAASAAVGYAAPPASEIEQLQPHVLSALAAVLLLLFAHCWIVLYLIGTGRALRSVVREYGLDPSVMAEAGRLQGEAVPWLLLAMGLALGTFLLGAGAAANALPAWVHHGLAWAALAAQLYALWTERRVLAAHEDLIADVDRRIAERAA